MFSIFKKDEDEYIGAQWLSLFDRLYIPDYYAPNPDAQLGRIKIVEERCDGCGLCVRICPTKTLIMTPRSKPLKKGKRTISKVMSMQEEPMCISCGDCVAVCPNDACFVAQRMKMPRSKFKTINKGPLSLPRLFND